MTASSWSSVKVCARAHVVNADDAKKMPPARRRLADDLRRCLPIAARTPEDSRAQHSVAQASSSYSVEDGEEGRGGSSQEDISVSWPIARSRPCSWGVGALCLGRSWSVAQRTNHLFLSLHLRARHCLAKRESFSGTFKVVANFLRGHGMSV